MYIDLLVHSPDAGFGISPVLLTKYVRTHRGSYRVIADSLARSDFVHGSSGRGAGAKRLRGFAGKVKYDLSH